MYSVPIQNFIAFYVAYLLNLQYLPAYKDVTISGVVEVQGNFLNHIIEHLILGNDHKRQMSRTQIEH